MFYFLQCDPEELRERMCKTSCYEQGGSARHDLDFGHDAQKESRERMCKIHALNKEGVLAAACSAFWFSSCLFGNGGTR